MTHSVLRIFAALVVVLSILMGVCSAEETDWNESVPFDSVDEELDDESIEVDPETGEVTVTSVPETMSLFPDVQTYEWFYEYVARLFQAGVISGYPDGTFRPNLRVSVGEAFKMIILATGYNEQVKTGTHWASGYASFILNKGFLPNSPEFDRLDSLITREMICHLTANAIGIQRTLPTPYFTDTDDDAICALYEAGIISGYPDGSARPEEMLSRAELSAIVDRIYSYKQTLLANGHEGLLSLENLDLRTTEEGISFIKEREGFVEKPIWDYLQYSVGYGSRCDKDAYPNGITKTEADLLMRNIVAEFEDDLDRFLEKNGLVVTDAQYDALISFTYNNGSTWMTSGSRLANLLISGNYSRNEFASAFGIWCHVTQDGVSIISENLMKRRIMELNLFFFGDYSGRSDNFCYLLIQDGNSAIDLAFYERGNPYGILFAPESAEGTFVAWVAETGEYITADSIASSDHIVYGYYQ